jgi:hypothetical protein
MRPSREPRRLTSEATRWRTAYLDIEMSPARFASYVTKVSIGLQIGEPDSIRDV